MIRFGLDAAIFYKAYKNSSYKWFAAGALLTALHATRWSTDKSKMQKPAISLTDHIAQLKKNSAVIALPIYLASPLFSLVQEAEKRGISAIDLEFRYHMVGAYQRANFSQLPPFLQAACAKTQDAEMWVYRKVTGNDIRYPLTLSSRN
jgi:hypothetical protein